MYSHHKKNAFWAITKAKISGLIVALVIFALIIDHINYRSVFYPKSYNETSLFDVVNFKSKLGIPVSLMHDDSDGSITLYISFKGGSGLDSRYYMGAADVLSRLLISETSSIDNAALQQEFDDLGVSVTSYATRDRIVLSYKMLEYNKYRSLNLLKNLLTHKRFRYATVARVKSQHSAESKLYRQSNDYFVNLALRRSLFGNDARWQSPFGSATTLSRMTPANLATLKNKYINRKNIMVTISGRLNQDEASQLVDNAFSGLSSYGPKIPKTANPTFRSGVSYIKGRNNQNQSSVIFLFKAPSIVKTPMELHAADIINDHLGGGSALSSLLMRTVRRDNGLVYGITSNVVNTAYGNFWYIYASTSKKNVSNVIKLVQDTVSKYSSDYYSREAIDEVIQWSVGSYALSTVSSESKVSFLANMLYFGYSPEFLKSPETELSQITDEDMVKVANKYLNTKKMSIIVVQ